MTDRERTETDEFGRVLLSERHRLTDLVAGMHRDLEAVIAASRDSNADDEHDPEGQTIAYERSQLAALADKAQGRLGEVDAALERLSHNAFGRCEQCGDRITNARLEARPTARTCRSCAD